MLRIASAWTSVSFHRFIDQAGLGIVFLADDRG